MNNITIDRVIGATADQVWSVLADFPNIADWNSGVTASHSTSTEAGGVGATRHCDLAPMGELEETIRQWQPQQRMVISIDEAKKIPIKAGEMTFLLDAGEGETAFTMSYDFTARGGPLSGLVARLLSGQLKKGFNGFIDDLESAARAVSTG